MEYFAHLGYPCPSHCNPADHLVDLVSTDYDSKVTAARDSARIEGLVNAWIRHAATVTAARDSARIEGLVNAWTRHAATAAAALKGKRPAASATAATTATAPAAAAARAAPLPRHSTFPRSRPRSRPLAPSRQTRRCSVRRSPLVRFGLLVRRSWCQNVRWPLTERTTYNTHWSVH